MWLTVDDAVGRMCAIAAEMTGEETGPKELLLAPLVAQELLDYCHLEQIPEGALWAAAEELVSRCSGVSPETLGAQKVTLGDYAVQYSDSGSDGSSGSDWRLKLRPWRKLTF